MCAFLLPASGGECQTTHGTARQHYPSASLQAGVLGTTPPGTLSAPPGAPPPPGSGGVRCSATWAGAGQASQAGGGERCRGALGDGLGTGDVGSLEGERLHTG